MLLTKGAVPRPFCVSIYKQLRVTRGALYTINPVHVAHATVGYLGYTRRTGSNVKTLTLIGAVLLLLGLLSFVVPIPHQEDHGVRIGDAKIGVQTNRSERVPPLLSGVLVLGGVVAMAAGSRKGA